MQLQDIDHLRDEEAIVYCRSGNRSEQACLFLDSLGFNNTWPLTGGMLAWQEKFGSL
jgi:rhodanese-related sulfurtransferase